MAIHVYQNQLISVKGSNVLAYRHKCGWFYLMPLEEYRKIKTKIADERMNLYRAGVR